MKIKINSKDMWNYFPSHKKDATKAMKVSNKL